MPKRTDLQLRLASAEDWPLMWPIWSEVVRAGDTYVYDPGTPEDEARAAWLAGPPHETWVAYAGEALLGMYRVGPNHAGPGAHVANGSYMVGAAARGHGVGRVMVEHSLVRTRDIGYLAMQFNAVAATNVHAIRLYEEFGFSTVGIVPGGFRHPGAGLVDLLIMWREL